MLLLEKVIGNKRFILSQASLIEENVEVIVNPANEFLAHGGGVAGLISRTGGPIIQEESNQKAPIKTGEATFTSAGRLPFKYIIHTVGPIYNDGNHGEEKFLASAVKAALLQATNLQVKSLSMPAISTGIFGYPVQPAIIIIVQTIIEFLKGESSLETVNLCEYSPEKANDIKEIITKHFKNL